MNEIVRYTVPPLSLVLLSHLHMLLFNAGDGYSEAIVRGYKLGLISSNQYSNLTQCETVEGML